ncbi:unnamed protein product [Rhizoctonia solani]|nr:unnamed protein product [Rhizoctonia solani]
MLPLDLKRKFESTIAAARGHESAIAVIVTNNQVPEARFVAHGYLRALRVLRCHLKDQVLDGVALDERFNVKVAREISRRLEMARNPGLYHRDVRQRRSERMSR